MAVKAQLKAVPHDESDVHRAAMQGSDPTCPFLAVANERRAHDDAKASVAMCHWPHAAQCKSARKTSGKTAAHCPAIRETIIDHGGQASAATMMASAERAGHGALPSRAAPRRPGRPVLCQTMPCCAARVRAACALPPHAARPALTDRRARCGRPRRRVAGSTVDEKSSCRAQALVRKEMDSTWDEKFDALPGCLSEIVRKNPGSHRGLPGQRGRRVREALRARRRRGRAHPQVWKVRPAPPLRCLCCAWWPRSRRPLGPPQTRFATFLPRLAAAHRQNVPASAALFRPQKGSTLATLSPRPAAAHRPDMPARADVAARA